VTTAGLGRVGTARATLLLALGLVLLHMPSGLPAPLYPFYQRTLGISPATVSMLFAVYVAGVLAGLLIMPLVLRHRHVMTGACGLSTGAEILFLIARNASDLFAAHFLQGVALGLFTGVVPVFLAESDRSGRDKKVGRVTTSANAVGLAAGPLWSGLLLEYAPWPGRLVWVIQIVATVAIMPFLRVTGGSGRLDTARSPVRAVTGTLVSDWPGRAALLAGFCAFSSGGLLASLGSVVLHSVIGVGSSAVAGVLVALCFVMSAATGAVKFRSSDLSVVALGLGLIAGGCLALVGAVAFASLPLMVTAAAACGAGAGLGLQGGIQIIARQGDSGRRGQAMSLYFMACYLGTTIASLGVGGLIDLAGLTHSFNGYSTAVAALCGVGLLCCLAGSRATATADAPAEQIRPS
jgi:MFS family permease